MSFHSRLHFWEVAKNTRRLFSGMSWGARSEVSAGSATSDGHEVRTTTIDIASVSICLVLMFLMVLQNFVVRTFEILILRPLLWSQKLFLEIYNVNAVIVDFRIADFTTEINYMRVQLELWKTHLGCQIQNFSILGAEIMENSTHELP